MDSGVDWSGSISGNRVVSNIPKICRELGYPYYGFLLYHAGHTRIRTFLREHLDFLDQVSGPRFLVVTLVDKHNHPLSIDRITKQRNKIAAELRKWRNDVTPFSPNKCFEIASALGVPRKELPALILYRAANGYRGFARLRLRDSWFQVRGEEVDETMRWMSDLFDRLDKALREGRIANGMAFGPYKQR